MARKKRNQGLNQEKQEQSAVASSLSLELVSSPAAPPPSSSCPSMFAQGFRERHDLEQYFWSEGTVLRLIKALDVPTWEGHVCCLATPSLAHAFYHQHVDDDQSCEGSSSAIISSRRREEALLDIDTRFSYLPGFRYFDLRSPSMACEGDDFRVVVFDPPFFYVPMEALFRAVASVVKGDFQGAKLLLGFLRREEASLLACFAPFRLRRTKFLLEYASVKPNKWRNYALYSNVDLTGIKRI